MSKVGGEIFKADAFALSRSPLIDNVFSITTNYYTVTCYKTICVLTAARHPPFPSHISITLSYIRIYISSPSSESKNVFMNEAFDIDDWE